MTGPDISGGDTVGRATTLGRDQGLRLAMAEISELASGQTGSNLEILWRHLAAMERLLPFSYRKKIIAARGALLDAAFPDPEIITGHPADRLAALLAGRLDRILAQLWEHAATLERILPEGMRHRLTAEFTTLLEPDLPVHGKATRQ